MKQVFAWLVATAVLALYVCVAASAIAGSQIPPGIR